MAKATKKQALGRGLSALLKDPENDINSAEDKNADKVVGNIIELEALLTASIKNQTPHLGKEAREEILENWSAKKEAENLIKIYN